VVTLLVGTLGKGVGGKLPDANPIAKLRILVFLEYDEGKTSSCL
jgi:hypothetical protein